MIHAVQVNWCHLASASQNNWWRLASQNKILLVWLRDLHRRARKHLPFRRPVFLQREHWSRLRNDVAYSDNPVKLIGISAGVGYGALGSTHHSLHDFAVLRAINNITIVAPADNYETAAAIKLAAAAGKPVYLFWKEAMPDLLQESDQSFRFGKGRIIRDGDDVFYCDGRNCIPGIAGSKKTGGGKIIFMQQ